MRFDLPDGRRSTTSVLGNVEGLRTSVVTNTSLRGCLSRKNCVGDYISGLTRVTITECSLQTMEGLEGLTRLKELHLSSNQLQTLSGMKGLTCLRKLWANDNRLNGVRMTATRRRHHWTFVDEGGAEYCHLASKNTATPLERRFAFEENGMGDHFCITNKHMRLRIQNIEMTTGAEPSAFEQSNSRRIGA